MCDVGRIFGLRNIESALNRMWRRIGGQKKLIGQRDHGTGCGTVTSTNSCRESTKSNKRIQRRKPPVSTLQPFSIIIMTVILG